MTNKKTRYGVGFDIMNYEVKFFNYRNFTKSL